MRTTPQHPRIWLLVGALLGAGITGLAVGAVAFALAPPKPAVGLAPSRFVDEAASSGLDHAYRGGFEYFVGGGVAAFDCDDDLLPDLYLAGGTEPAELYRNRSSVGGSLSFEPVAGGPGAGGPGAGVATDLTGVTGAYPLDIDGDGLIDLAVVRIGENVLLRGLGDCRFERANETWGFDGGDGWTVGFSAQWARDDDRLPTMVFGNYLRSAEDRTCDDHELVVPDRDRDGNSEDGAGVRFAPTIPVTPGYCTLSMLFSDWQRTGRMDLRVANDRHYYQDGEEQLLHLDDDRLVPYTAEDGWQPLQIWGMGIASVDLTGDGRPEVFITSQGDNKLQTLADDATGPTYGDIALERGVTAHRPFIGDDTLPSTAWHPEFADVNNDSLVDLYVSKGNVDAMVEFAERDPSNLLIGQTDGSFAESAVAAGIVSYERARGAAVIDLNGDGMLDLVQVNREAPVGVWRNVGFGSAEDPEVMGHWLAVRVAQPGPNRNAVGGRLQVRTENGRTQDREITVGGGHASGELGPIHVGLGSFEATEVRVIWPDGTVGAWYEVAADQMVSVDRAADRAATVSP